MVDQIHSYAAQARAANTDGDLIRALIAYNAGPRVARSVQRGTSAWRRLHAYPRNVLAAYKSFLLMPEQVAAR